MVQTLHGIIMAGILEFQNMVRDMILIDGKILYQMFKLMAETQFVFGFIAREK